MTELIVLWSSTVPVLLRLSICWCNCWVLFIGMSAPLVIFIGQISWLSVLVNFFALPIVALITVPLCLLAGVMFFIKASWAEAIWQWASVSITALWKLLAYFPENWGLFNFSIANSAILSIALLLAATFVITPKGLTSRWLLLLPLLLLCVAYKPRAPLRLTVLDVGQGLSVVAEVGKRVLVYDAGPSYSPQFNAGSAIVAPYVRSRGIQVIDKLLISHGDMDHAGGFLGLNDSIDVEQNLLAAGYFDKLVDLSSGPSKYMALQ